jgi:hypothetical protein
MNVYTLIYTKESNFSYNKIIFLKYSEHMLMGFGFDLELSQNQTQAFSLETRKVRKQIGGKPASSPISEKARSWLPLVCGFLLLLWCSALSSGLLPSLFCLRKRKCQVSCTHQYFHETAPK